ncbi:putative Dual specificity tyrosine-phosphorylation-regulated kinase 4 [Paratrimastix pyriformis]|uniref:dual-specificity kinase n=1 Tax=Paratrimastix pyriformis TaxID=342808 RepID=A0ABQ8UVN9_9EUKA|nr:putative Dual specificity tyrosine-phosphorylation-regulated kinase 4 [Paratrimastix pyriformis]
MQKTTLPAIGGVRAKPPDQSPPGTRGGSRRIFLPLAQLKSGPVHGMSGESGGVPAEDDPKPQLVPLFKEMNMGDYPQVPQTTRKPSHPTVVLALKMHGDVLTPYEQGEILEYPQVFFLGPAAKKVRGTPQAQNNCGYDDDRGDYHVVLHDHLSYRYEVVDACGKGSFGQVLKVFDHRLQRPCALKIIRNKKRFHCQGLVEVKILEFLKEHGLVVEVKILEFLKEHDPDDVTNNVRMEEYFYFRNHLCISFELLSINLYEFMKNSNFTSMSLSLIRRFAVQLLNSLRYLHRHHIIHCDLKPENILLKHPLKSGIKVIDFGSSCFESERIYTYIQSRFYRSPEVILGLPYDVAIDMWSFGCILAELYTGYPLFPGENEVEQLACIMEVLGLPPRRLVESSTRRKYFFDSQGHPRIVANSRGKKRKPGAKDLPSVLRCPDPLFIHFLEGCLRWDPRERFTPEDALQHEWILEGITRVTSERSNATATATTAAGGSAIPGSDVDPTTSLTALPPLAMPLIRPRPTTHATPSANNLLSGIVAASANSLAQATSGGVYGSPQQQQQQQQPGGGAGGVYASAVGTSSHHHRTLQPLGGGYGGGVAVPPLQMPVPLSQRTSLATVRASFSGTGTGGAGGGGGGGGGSGSGDVMRASYDGGESLTTTRLAMPHPHPPKAARMQTSPGEPGLTLPQDPETSCILASRCENWDACHDRASTTAALTTRSTLTPVALGDLFAILPRDLLPGIVAASDHPVIPYVQLLSLSHGIRSIFRGTPRELFFDLDEVEPPTADVLAALIGPCKGLLKLSFRSVDIGPDNPPDRATYGCCTEAACAGWVDEAFGGHDRLAVLEYLPTFDEPVVERILHHLPGLVELHLGTEIHLSASLLASIVHSCPRLQSLRRQCADGCDELDLKALAPLADLRTLRAPSILDERGLPASSNLTAIGRLELSVFETVVLKPLASHLTRVRMTLLDDDDWDPENLPGAWLSRLERLAMDSIPFSPRLAELLDANRDTLQRLMSWRLPTSRFFTRTDITALLPAGIYGRLERLTLPKGVVLPSGPPLPIASHRLKRLDLQLLGRVAALTLDCPALVELSLPAEVTTLALKCPRLRELDISAVSNWFSGLLPDLESLRAQAWDPAWLPGLLVRRGCETCP